MTKPQKPDDWMPLKIGKYLQDTTHLTRDQHGGYLLLLMAYWTRGGALPADDARLAAIVKATAKEWKSLKPVLSEFFVERDGRWHQKRADEELAKAVEIVSAKSEAGKKGAEARWQKDGNRNAPANGKDDASAITDGMRTQWQTDAPLPSPKPDSSLRSESPREKSKRTASKQEPLGFSEWYEAFPRKEKPGDARKAYARALEKTDAQTLLDGARRYAQQRRNEDQKFTQYPSTWLNGECWLNGQSLNGNGALPFTPAFDANEDPWERKVRKFKESGFWLDVDGHMPDDAWGRCSAPKKILAKYGYATGVSA